MGPHGVAWGRMPHGAWGRMGPGPYGAHGDKPQGPQVIPKAMYAASWPLAGAVVLGVELCQRQRQRPHHAARGALLQFEWLRKTRGAQALRRCGGRPGRDG
jgi:hypothetical protein